MISHPWSRWFTTVEPWRSAVCPSMTATDRHKESSSIQTGIRASPRRPILVFLCFFLLVDPLFLCTRGIGTDVFHKVNTVGKSKSPMYQCIVNFVWESPSQLNQLSKSVSMSWAKAQGPSRPDIQALGTCSFKGRWIALDSSFVHHWIALDSSLDSSSVHHVLAFMSTTDDLVSRRSCRPLNMTTSRSVKTLCRANSPQESSFHEVQRFLWEKVHDSTGHCHEPCPPDCTSTGNCEARPEFTATFTGLLYSLRVYI